MMIYKGILQQRSLQRKVLILAACGILLYLEIVKAQYFYIPLTILLVLAVFHRKEHIVSEEGVDIRFSLFGMTSTNRWTWDQVTAVQPDFLKERPNARLLIEKESMIRSFLFTPEDCQGVMEMAAKMNPDIFIDDYTAEEQEQMEEEKRQIRERQREQKAKAKKKRK